MFHQNLRDWAITAMVTSCIVLALALSAPLSLPVQFISLVAFIAAMAVVVQYWATHGHKKPVDIWEFHRKLMVISNQKMPMGNPMLHKGAVLYGALTLEELSETLFHMGDTIVNATVPTNSGLRLLGLTLREQAITCSKFADQLRDELARQTEFTVYLTRLQAQDLLDDVTDVAVTTAGMGISMGLPAEEGYVDVALSNHSKANPDTGVIDKDPSGKWIKGRAYKEPNLPRVLSAHCTFIDEITPA